MDRSSRQKIINGERSAEETGRDKIQSTEGGLKVSFKQEEGPFCCCGRMEGETMGIDEGRKQGWVWK